MKDYNKVYVCLFTCASTRAVHLELTRGMNIQDFPLAFRKFASRRGYRLQYNQTTRGGYWDRLIRSNSISTIVSTSAYLVVTIEPSSWFFPVNLQFEKHM